MEECYNMWVIPFKLTKLVTIFGINRFLSSMKIFSEDVGYLLIRESFDIKHYFVFAMVVELRKKYA